MGEGLALGDFSEDFASASAKHFLGDMQDRGLFFTLRRKNGRKILANCEAQDLRFGPFWPQDPVRPCGSKPTTVRPMAGRT